MTKTFLDFIQVSKKEDLTTSVFEYLLQQNIDEAFPKIFFDLLEIKKSRFETEQQKPIQRGYIDLFIQTHDSGIVLENKFNAPFTWSDEDGHQLFKYCKWLYNQRYINKHLVILTIQRRKKEVEEYIHGELSEFVGINIRVLYWEELLEKCYSSMTDVEMKLILNSLRIFISNNFSKFQLLSEEGVQMLCSKEFAKAFIEIEEMIIKIKELISQYPKFVISQPKKSLFEPDYGSIGLYFRQGNNEYWFGLNPSLWVKTGFPLYLELRSFDGSDDFSNMATIISEKYLTNEFSKTDDGINYTFNLTEYNDQDKIFKKIVELAI